MPALGIPGYVDVEVLAEGGFGIVYRAWHPTFERSVAIKVLPADTDEDTARFERECAAVGSLSGHPNIVTVYDTGITSDGRRFIVMEFLPGGSLADRLARSGPITFEEVLEVGVKLAGATESAHRAGILHGDIKPENVLLSGFAEPKLADFGIARIRGRPDHADEVLSATIAHAAPEVLEGAQPTVGIRRLLTCRRLCSASFSDGHRSTTRLRSAWCPGWRASPRIPLLTCEDAASRPSSAPFSSRAWPRRPPTGR